MASFIKIGYNNPGCLINKYLEYIVKFNTGNSDGVERYL